MKKIELADKLSKRLSVDRDRASFIISTFVDVVKETLSEGEEVMLAGFGKFSPELRGGVCRQDYFRGGKDTFVYPYIKTRFAQYPSCKYEMFSDNKDFWSIVARKNGKIMTQEEYDKLKGSAVAK